MPKGGAWSNSNKARMGSSAVVGQNQGGGAKKAGFPHQIGRDSWVSHFIGSVAPVTGRCCNLGKLAETLVFTRNTVRPVGLDARIRMR